MFERWPALQGALLALGGILGGAGFFMAAFFGLGYILFDTPAPASRLGRTQAACDRFVETLMTSPDQVEVIRAGMLVQQLDCSISRRLR